jgi:hypothetical protein
VVQQTAFGYALILNDGEPYHTTTNQVVDQQVVVVPGSSVVALLWNEVDAGGSIWSYYGISFDGSIVSRVSRTSYKLGMRYAQFDPASDTPAIHSSLARPANSKLYMVQFVTQPLDVYRSAVKDLGAKIYRFTANHAYVMKMEPSVRDAVAALPFVRAVVPFHPAYEPEQQLVEELEAGVCSDETERYSIAVFERGAAQQNAVAALITSLGGVVEHAESASIQMEATLTLDQLDAILDLDEVSRVSRAGIVSAAGDVAPCLSGAADLEDIEGYTGVGIRGEVMDMGLQPEHDAYDHPTSDYPLIHCFNYDTVEYTYDGNRVYGLVFGDGTGDTCTSSAPCEPGAPCGRGILPDGEGIFATQGYCAGPGNPNPPYIPPGRDRHTSQLVGDVCCDAGDQNCPYNAVFQTNSWGDQYGEASDQYQPKTEALDDIAFKYDILICQAQGNCGDPDAASYCSNLPELGTRQSARQAWAKNVVSVGGIKHFNTICRDDDSWDGSCLPPECPPYTETYCTDTAGSTGPAADGRVKPDLAHFYENLATTCETDNICYANACNGQGTCSTAGGCISDPCYGAPFSGTSAATPITCGYAGLIFEMWHDEAFCGFGGGASVFDSRPHMTTMKALMINTAYRYPILNEPNSKDFTRFNQGWGMVDAKALYDLRDKTFIIDETRMLSDVNNSVTYKVLVDEQEPFLRVTLVYADPAGIAQEEPPKHVKNDLNLRMEYVGCGDPPCGNHQYWGNCGLLAESVSSHLCTSANHPDPLDTQLEVVDNVENVFVPNPTAGLWEITVSADYIAEDGHVRYVNDDPTECCADPENCVVSGPTDVDCALVATGVSDKRACCPGGFGGGPCRHKTPDQCQQEGGTSYCQHFCSTMPFGGRCLAQH